MGKIELIEQIQALYSINKLTYEFDIDAYNTISTLLAIETNLQPKVIQAIINLILSEETKNTYMFQTLKELFTTDNFMATQVNKLSKNEFTTYVGDLYTSKIIEYGTQISKCTYLFVQGCGVVVLGIILVEIVFIWVNHNQIL